MKYARTALVLLLTFSASGSRAQIGTPIPTPLDQWRPILPGTWKITSSRSGSTTTSKPATTTTVACPYSAPLFLTSVANIKAGEAGCEHETYQVSDHTFHIATRCRQLRSNDHFETTTLQVSDNGRHFLAVTTWRDSGDNITLQRNGELLSRCRDK